MCSLSAGRRLCLKCKLAMRMIVPRREEEDEDLLYIVQSFSLSLSVPLSRAFQLCH